MSDNQCFICKSWMDEDQLVKGNDGFLRCYEHAYLNQETLIAALREAGEKMAERLRKLNNLVGVSDYSKPLNNLAIAEWEAANK